MPKRTLKRKVKKAIIYFFIFLFSLFVILILYFSGKNFIYLFHLINSNNNDQSIIRPIGNIVIKSDIEKKLSEKNIIADSVMESATSGAIIAKIKDGPEVFFSKSKDVDWQINSLQLIITKLNIENKKAILLDLRFDQPIVKF